MTDAPERIWAYPVDFGCGDPEWIDGFYWDRSPDGIADEAEYIRADLVPQWQPIETAPKDGIDCLVYNGASEEMFVAYWYIGGWWFSDRHKLKDQPTHWMPLPAPPD